MFADIRTQKALRQAEGYLDLIFALADRWPLSVANRERMALRALEALESIPDEGRLRGTIQYMRGLAYRALEAYPEAIPPLASAAELEPDNFHIYLALAWCYKRIGRLDLAIESLEDAEEIAPDEAIIQFNLACYWCLASNKKRTLFHLSRSFELDPDYREKVNEESDFDPLRRDPDFQLLNSVIV